MKKILLPVLFTLLATLSIQAAKKVSGYFIDLSGKKNNVTFLIQFDLFGSVPQFENLQYKVTYVENDKKIKLSPDDASEISFTHKGITYRMISVTNPYGSSAVFSSSTSVFLKLEVDGMIRLFSFFSSHHNPGMYNSSTGTTTGGTTSTSERYLLQKGNGEIIRPRSLYFKKDVIPLFDDCEVMNDKIKTVTKATVEAIVKEYNEKCK